MLFLLKHRVYTICPYTAKPILAQVFVSSPIPPMSSGPFNENVDTEALRREMESQEGAGIWQHMWGIVRTLIQSKPKNSRWLWEFYRLNQCIVPVYRWAVSNYRQAKPIFILFSLFFTVFCIFDVYIYIYIYGGHIYIYIFVFLMCLYTFLIFLFWKNWKIRKFKKYRISKIFWRLAPMPPTPLDVNIWGHEDQRAEVR